MGGGNRAGIECGEGIGGGRVSGARSEADGIYEMAGKGWWVAARNLRSSQDSFDIGDANFASEAGSEIKQAGSS